MSVRLLNLDISDKVMQRGASSASMTDVVGILTQSRDYVLADNVGEFNPFSPAGLLARNSWRNETIVETEVNQREIFTGAIKQVGSRLDQRGYQTLISAREPIGTILDFVVDENDISTLGGFKVNGNHSAGDQTITIDTGTTDIQDNIPVLVSFSTFLVPRYQINSATGSPTTSIVLDRPLEGDVADTTDLRVSIPTKKTVPEAIFDALNSAGIISLGNSFELLNTSDTASNYFIRMQIRTEDNVKLSSHISKLLDMGNLSLTVNPAGIIDIIRNIGYDGRNILDEITGAEILDPYQIRYDDSKLVIGYDCLYLDNESVSIASGDIDQSFIDEYAGRNRWQPIGANSSLASEYKYLYESSTSADYFGQLRLDYYGAPRVRVSAGMKQSKSDNVLERYQVQLGKEFVLSMPTGHNIGLIEEPIRVVGYQYSEQAQRYNSIELELTNFPIPNLAR